MKKARAALRLLRGALGRRVFAREDAVLREASHPLGALRDSKVLLERLDELTSGLGAAPLGDLRPTLQREWLHARRASLRGAASQMRSHALHELAARSAHWRVGAHGWSVLGPAIERTYARGRRAFAAAREEPSVEHLHRWRKQAKYLRDQLQLLEPVAPKPIGRLARSADRLSESLGLDHDLALLRAKVRLPDRAAQPGRRALTVRIDARRAREQARAFALGRRLYPRKPGAFARSLRNHWRAWQRR